MRGLPTRATMINFDDFFFSASNAETSLFQNTLIEILLRGSNQEGKWE